MQRDLSLHLHASNSKSSIDTFIAEIASLWFLSLLVNLLVAVY